MTGMHNLYQIVATRLQFSDMGALSVKVVPCHPEVAILDGVSMLHHQEKNDGVHPSRIFVSVSRNFNGHAQSSFWPQGCQRLIYISTRAFGPTKFREVARTKKAITSERWKIMVYCVLSSEGPVFAFAAHYRRLSVNTWTKTANSNKYNHCSSLENNNELDWSLFIDLYRIFVV